MEAVAQPAPVHLPRGLRPMLLGAGELPSGPGWRFEPKWDGFRALVHVGDDRAPVRVVSRHGTDLTGRFPELRGLPEAVHGERVVLDGELVVLGADGRPDFDQLRRRLVVSGSRLRRLAAAAPAAFVAFDLLWCREDLTGLPYERRRGRLEGLDLDGRSWQTTPVTDDGTALWQAVVEHQLEGVVAKRLASRYQPGRRTGDWVKVKRWQHCEVVVGGFVPGRNGVRSLLVGLHHDAPPTLGLVEPPPLRYVGEVEYGFRPDDRAGLAETLLPHARRSTPFAGGTRHRDVVHVDPVLAVRVRFQCWSEGRLRHAVYAGSP